MLMMMMCSGTIVLMTEFCFIQSEILFKICSYLDLQSLFQLSETCVKLHQVAVDPLLYTEINLRPYWNLVNSDLLDTLGKR